MRVVFGIDVSKASSEVAIWLNSEKVHGYTIPNLRWASLVYPMT
ncbi:hypothetical protein FMV2238Y02_04100 [Streptococcus canis]|uniref:Transposase n=1 Tax=Streptococcus canis TaxID=1329 RepID=A0A3P5Y508_STRCB|nr:hypothetical protein FMV2238Y02_04100 [Streptococcus canis]